MIVTPSFRTDAEQAPLNGNITPLAEDEHTREASELNELEQRIREEISCYSVGYRSLESSAQQLVNVSFWRGHGKSVDVSLVPGNDQAQYEIGDHWVNFFYGYPAELFLTLLEKFKESFKYHEWGEIAVTDDQITIKFGARRVSQLAETEVAYAFALCNQVLTEWTGANLAPSFYSLFVADRVAANSSSTSPIDWSLERMRILGGLIINAVGYDYPLAAIEEPLRKIAPLAANLRPDSHRHDLQFPATEENRSLIASLGPEPSPELAYIVLSLSHSDAHSFLKGESFFHLRENFENLLNKGLAVDRLTELARSFGELSAENIEHAIKIAQTIFSPEVTERPWWFPENASLVPQNPSSEWGTPVNREQHLMLAQRSLSAYPYALEIWERKGVALAALDGLSLASAVSIISAITEDYGLGNIPRACHVVDFAIAALQELPPAQRDGRVEKLASLLREQRPDSPLMGLLEGNDGGFELPGIFPLLSNLHGPEYVQSKNYLTLTAQDLIRAVEATSRPLEERALIDPNLRLNSNRLGLISDLGQIQSLRLPLIDELKMSGPTSTPISTWIDFNHRMQELVPNARQRRELTASYCSLYAHKLPEPLNPPQHFLEFLKLFNQVPDPNYRYSFLEHPRDRAYVQEQNAQSSLDRHAIVSCLIDTSLIGILSWQEIEEILDWMVASDPGIEEVRTEIETDLAWSHYWNEKDNQYNWFHQLHEHDTGLQVKIRSLENQIFVLTKSLESSEDSKEGAYLSRARTQLERLHQERANLDDSLLREVTGEDPAQYREERRLSEERYNREQRYQDEIQREVNSQVEHLASERITQVGKVYDVLRFSHGLVTAGYAPAQALGPLVRSLLLDLKDGTLSIPTDDSRAIPSFTELVESLRELDRLQLIKKVPVLERIFVDYRNSSELFERLTVIPRIARAFEKARAAIDKYNSDSFSGLSFQMFSNEHNPSHSVDDVLRRQHQMLSTVQNHLAPILSYLNDGAPLTLVEELCWGWRYQLIAPQVSQFIRDDRARRGVSSFAERSPRTSKEITIRSTDLAYGIWGFLEASENYDPLSPASDERQEFRAIAHDQEARDSEEALPLMGNSIIPFHLNAGVSERFKALQDQLRESRTQSFGKLPLGGKIHVMHGIDSDQLSQLMSCFGFNSTSFVVDGANRSLIIPPMPSAGEIALIASFLAKERVIDDEYPELQMCLPGRLSPEDCGILGASVILASQRLVRYTPKSFGTASNFQTGYRIMLYDAGGYRAPFPFDVSRTGRTDMQGRKHLSDLYTFQDVGTVLSYAADDLETHTVLKRDHLEQFREVREWYVSAFREVLSNYPKLANVLSVAWVNSRSDYSVTEAGDFYYQAIAPLSEAFEDSIKIFDSNGRPSGVVGEVEALLEELRNRVRLIQQSMLNDPYYDSQRAELFNV